MDEAEFDAEADLGHVLHRATVLAQSAIAAQATELSAIVDVVLLAKRRPEAYVLLENQKTRKEAIEFAERSAFFELPTQLSQSEDTIRNKFHMAQTLTRRLPAVWTGFRHGEISYPNAQTAAQTITSLPEDPDTDRQFEEAIIGAASTLVPTRFRVKARVVRERLHPTSIEQRHATARADRRTAVELLEDGMAWLHVFSDADAILRAHARIDANARSLRREPAETRSLEQLRTDVATDLLTGVGTPHEVKSHVNITLPATALLNDEATRRAAQNDPAVLDGYGPIDLETARRLAAGAPSFRRLFTDPVSGVVLTMDRSTYRPTAAQREWLRVKFGTCAAPGCTRTVPHSDADHVFAWKPGGVTNDDNLIPLSRDHHRLRGRE